MKHPAIIISLLFLFFESIFGLVIYYSISTEINYHLKFRETQLTTAVESITTSYSRLVEAIYEKEINTPDIINLIASADTADEETHSLLRGRLYRRVYPTFKLLKDRKIRVLQFTLSDGQSFLRMHRPDLYADIIADDRPILKRVLITGRDSQGFEHGRVYPGFRTAFPLIKEGKIVGVADFSVAFDAFYDILSDNDSNSNTFSQMLLRKDLVEAISHPSIKSLFRSTPVHADYIMEDENSPLRDINLSVKPPAYVSRLDKALGSDRDVEAAMREGRTFSLYKCMNDLECYQVVLLSVKDSSNRTSAYIVGSFSGDEYPGIIRNHLLAFSLGSLLFFLALRYYRNWLKSQQQLQTISANMAEGMYVMNHQGAIVFANKAAESILGYTQKEMLGKSAHNLFHHHSSEDNITEQDCHIRTIPLSGEIYRSSEETFTDRDGNLIRAEITSSPLWNNAHISGAVVLFRDITLDYENRIRQKQTDTAFQNMSEAVVVTDANIRIVAVNHAFTQITGFSEEFVIGMNPSVLASGLHDRTFYQNLWRKIEHDGYWEGEIFNRRKNGEIYPEWINISVIKDREDQVLSYVAVFSDITENQKKELRLQELAYTDQLTNLPNRTSFMRLLEQSIRHSERVHTRVALLYLDLDHFKQINDTLGHLMGDKLLSEAANRLRDIVRQDDVLARLGGDEFIFMIETFEQDNDPARVAKKLLACLKQPFHIEDRVLYVSASIGISLFPDDGSDPTTLLKNADAAMYRSKRSGRGSYSYFTEDMAREAEKRFHLESDLRSALSEGSQLHMLYQPKFSFTQNGLIGCEALIRWQHPTRGLLSPTDFLPIAHDAGLMPEITEFVIHQVSKQINRWTQMGLDPGKVSINLDSQTLKCSDFNTRLMRIVSEEDIKPEQMEIEITETVILEQSDYMNRYNELVESGFSISIDDFGTGESSLFRLKQIPASTLKVDRTFIMDVAHNLSDQAILQSIIGMAKTLGKKVLCEGVEDSGQLGVLKEIGCDEIQGYYLAKPMPPDTLKHFYSSFENNEFN